MPISPYLKELRTRIGTSLVLCPGVAAIVRDAAGRILMLERSDDGNWGLPAGSVDPGEAPAQTIVREVWEETGLRVVPVRLLGTFGGAGFRVTYPNGDQTEYTVTLFECRVVGGTLHPRDGEALDLRYYEPDALPSRISPVTRFLLDASHAGEGPAFQWDEAWLEELAE